jgi:colanic acid biosynthesis glycosyl transferase WcaI
MRILLLAQHFKPESVGPANFLYELATDLVGKGHQVTMLTAFPNYPSGVIFDGYRGKIFQRETIDGVEVIRTWIYTSPSKAFWQRIVNFGSFCTSSLLGGLVAARRPDVICAFLPPLPLGVTAVALAAAKRARVLVNIQDIFPQSAVVNGVLNNPQAIRFFEAMERWIYRRSHHIVVISEGFRQDLLSRGVPAEKLSVVSNWADPDFFQPGPKENSFRRELSVGSRFALIYSGGLGYNSNVEPVLRAADILRNEPFAFVIIGDGIRKPGLERLTRQKKLTNVCFKPFQPWERYPEVLLAADMNLVTLSKQEAFVSVPSKIFKQMAAGRAILAITTTGNEVDRLVKDAQCGLCVPPDEPVALVDALRWAAAHPEELAQMGRNARRCLERHHSRSHCTAQIEGVLRQVVGR